MDSKMETKTGRGDDNKMLRAINRRAGTTGRAPQERVRETQYGQEAVSEGLLGVQGV